MKASKTSVGIVGLGLMGRSIVVNMLAAGHPVKAIAPTPQDVEKAEERISQTLRHCDGLGLVAVPLEKALGNLLITEDYQALSDCALVIECVIEKIPVKQSVLGKIDAVVSPDTIIGTNTSAIPISTLQEMVSHPERFVGIHWAEPAYLTRFLEIICGEKTTLANARKISDMAVGWRKEPTILRKDIPGFITNRLMYAVFREVFALVEAGHISLTDIDKCFRYDAGSWMTLMGIFRRWDYLGLEDLGQMNLLFKKLSNTESVPETMEKIVENGGRGILTGSGLYQYSPAEADQWADSFAAFNEDIYDLAAQYPAITALNHETDAHQ
ncbi:3-hydroxyacyl-CoA dehydrogenase NAD-binding domain-containing protein [Ravibacter arvi]|uniref:3-hydroxyacyl-CoA dehydrogenase NAD-binding domain-containing protein n=1 Tax=Ravibacter arvi TaxID=2051041 RepID=A0ABP8LR42_9BACT